MSAGSLKLKTEDIDSRKKDPEEVAISTPGNTAGLQVHLRQGYLRYGENFDPHPERVGSLYRLVLVLR